MSDIINFIQSREYNNSTQFIGYIINTNILTFENQTYGSYQLYDAITINKIKNLLNMNGYTNITYDLTEYIHQDKHKLIHNDKKEYKLYTEINHLLNKNVLLINYNIINIVPTRFPNLSEYDEKLVITVNEYSNLNNSFIIQIIQQSGECKNSDNYKYYIKIIINKITFEQLTKEVFLLQQLYMQ